MTFCLGLGERRKSQNYINGIKLPAFIEKKSLEELRDFPLQDGDLFVVTYPKSGTVWTLHLTTLIRNTSNQLQSEHLVDQAMVWLEREGKEAGLALPSPRRFASHLPYHMVPGGPPAHSNAKYIYVARNPKDVAVSFYYHLLRMKSIENIEWDEFFELFIAGKTMFGPWFDHVLDWWRNKDADNILFLRYEDMKKDLPGAVRTISQFMGYDLDQSQIESIADQSTFEKMKANPMANPDNSKYAMHFKEDAGSFMRKGVIGDWKNHFSDEQSARFDAEFARRMAGSGLEQLASY